MSRRRRTPPKRRPQPDRATPHDRAVAVRETRVYYQGPLPPPEVLIQYNEAHPKATEIILRSFENEGEHRRKMESTIVGKGIKRADRGQVFAFIIAMTALVVGGTLLLFDKSIGGYSAIGAGFTGVVMAFLAGRRRARRPTEERAG